MIYSLDHVSGAHFNPAVSIGAMVEGRMPIFKCLLFIIIQTLGAIVGALLGYGIAGTDNIKPFEPDSSLEHPELSALIVEFFFAFALSLVMLQVTRKNNEEPNSYFGLSIGFVVIAGAASVRTISGAVFNPAVGTAVDFASLLRDGDMRRLWIYWVGPPVGGLLAGLLSRYLAKTMEEEEREQAMFLEYVRAAELRNLPPPEDDASKRLPLRVLITEFIGTFYISLVAALGGEALAIGCIVAAMIYMGDDLCGADYNPAVSLGVLVRYGLFVPDWWKTLVVAVCQVAGGILAGFIAYAARQKISFPNDDSNLGPDGIHGDWGAVLYEGLWTMLLVYAVCASTTQIAEETDPNGRRKGHGRSYHGLVIGFVILAGVIGGSQAGSGSGGVFNPAMGTGICAAAVADENQSGRALWVYWVGPVIGALFGGGLFTLLHSHEDSEPVDPELLAFDDAGQAGMNPGYFVPGSTAAGYGSGGAAGGLVGGGLVPVMAVNAGPGMGVAGAGGRGR